MSLSAHRCHALNSIHVVPIRSTPTGSVDARGRRVVNVVVVVVVVVVAAAAAAAFVAEARTRERAQGLLGP